MNKLTQHLIDEQQTHLRGGIYHKTQVQLAYNSNRIEGSKLTEEQTRYIFETRTIGFKDQEAVPVDDIIETSNHFLAFDYLLSTIETPLSNDIIKEFHRILKTGTADAQKPYFNVGGWKKLGNEVEGHETCSPDKVENEMSLLTEWYSICLRNNIMPFVIDNNHKMFYYRGLSEYNSTPGFLIETMQSAQDTYAAWLNYFSPELAEGLAID